MPSPSGTDAPSATDAAPAGPGHPPDTSGSADPVLAAEREHLRESREFLRLMRENVLGLRAMAGDRVSEEYLKADLHRRAEVLRDLPGTPLFFGRLDYTDGSAWSEPELHEDTETTGQPASGVRFHIGRRHVH